jgi:hypothetical protein
VCASLPPEYRHIASEHRDWGSPIEHLLSTEARAGGAAPSPIYSGDQASSTGDVVELVFWTLLTPPKSDFGDAEVEVVAKEHQQQEDTVP